MRSPVWSNVDYPVLARHGQNATWVSDPVCELYAYSWDFGMSGCVHPGIDIKMPEGTAVHAIRSGTVERIRNRNISGRMEVVIRDVLGHEHLYTHLSSRAVEVGERVTPGQRVGASGTMSVPHLHFEHRVPDASTKAKWRIINPVSLLTPEQETPMAYTPKIIDKWLHVAQDDYPAVWRYNANRNGNKPRKIVVHVQEGSNLGSWQHFHTVQASSTVLIGKNGDIWRLVPEQHGPWTNGDVDNPDANVRSLIGQYGSDPNDWTLTIENEGFTGNLPYTDAQFESNVWQCVQWCKRYGLDENDILRHGQINSVDRPYCPERAPYPFITKLKARVKQELTGVEPTPPAPPAPSPTYAKPVTIPGLADLAEFSKKVGLAITAVNYKVRAIRKTPRYQSPAGKLIGPDIQAGHTFDIMATYQDAKGNHWFITPHWTRVRAEDVERVS